jgi:hypothetical protein
MRERVLKRTAAPVPAALLSVMRQFRSDACSKKGLKQARAGECTACKLLMAARMTGPVSMPRTSNDWCWRGVIHSSLAAALYMHEFHYLCCITKHDTRSIFAGIFAKKIYALQYSTAVADTADACTIGCVVAVEY